MDRLQGPINPCIFGDRQNLGCLEPTRSVDMGGGAIFNPESLSFGESQLHNWVSFGNPSLPGSSKGFHERMQNISFLQMLAEARSPPSPFLSTDPNLNMPSMLQKRRNYLTEMDSRIQAIEVESCIIHVSEASSPVKSETKKDQNPHSSRGAGEGASSANLEPNSPEICKTGTADSSTWVPNPAPADSSIRVPNPTPQPTKPPPARERRKRKSSQFSKNSEEVESQRMTHITVERNRRKQMNEHLNALRSLMPTSFIQRGDQASIIGGAIDFVKELEQLLQSLQAQKRKRRSEDGCSPDSSTPFISFFLSPQYTTYSSPCNVKYILDNYIDQAGDEFTAENKSAVADIEVTLIQTHANLKVLSRRRPGQLLKAIAALENLNLRILHLNIISIELFVLYSFNLKIEEECKVGSADEIATVVHQIFTPINGN